MEETNAPQMTFSSALPYPPVCAEQPNPFYARAMLDNIGGSNSEISAVSLYFYNNLITKDTDNLAHIFHKVSIVEMHHLEIFGELAMQLGANPRLWTHKGRQMRYWTPGYNKYPMKLPELLINSINSEKAAIQKYQSQLKQITDKAIVENLERIILDEQLHVEIFSGLYEKYCR